jgi:sec-independent protein translocase protein TatA
MFGISGEHLLILAIVLLIFGPRRLPELGNTMGKAIRNFKDSLAGVEEAKFRHLEEGGASTAAATSSAQIPQQQTTTPPGTSTRTPATESTASVAESAAPRNDLGSAQA